MHRKFIALVVSTAIAITGLSALPARADSDTTRLLAGLTALAIIGLAVNDHNRKQRRQTVSRNAPQADIPIHREYKPRRLPRELRRYVLPRQCLRKIHSYGDTKRVVGQRCMERNYGYMGSLPRNCHVHAWTRHGQRRGYSVECLRNNGYRLSRR